MVTIDFYNKLHFLDGLGRRGGRRGGAEGGAGGGDRIFYPSALRNPLNNLTSCVKYSIIYKSGSREIIFLVFIMYWAVLLIVLCYMLLCVFSGSFYFRILWA